MSRKRPSSKDVAKLAGVSRTTVSYVLNKKKDVKIKDSTKKRVFDAAKELNYFKDTNASNLKKNQSRTVAFITERTILDYRYSLTLYGAKKILNQNGYDVLLLDINKDDLIRSYNERRTDAFIFLSYIEKMDINRIGKIQKKMVDNKIPCVFCDYHMPLEPRIDIAYDDGAKKMGKLLIEKGLSKTIYFSANTKTIQEKLRIEGLNQSGLDYDIVFCDNIKKSFNEKKSIISCYDAILLGWHPYYSYVVYELLSLGIKPGKDIEIAILASGHEMLFPYKPFRVDLPLLKLGKEAANIVIYALEGKNINNNIKLNCSILT